MMPLGMMMVLNGLLFLVSALHKPIVTQKIYFTIVRLTVQRLLVVI
jgi:hypothetical protein